MNSKYQTIEKPEVPAYFFLVLDGKILFACQAFQPSGGILHVHGNVPKCDNRVEGKCPCLSMAVVLKLFWDATHFVLR
ncbi:hypothetical protein T03_14187 [Trichinella britovi]|uniref:Uncharacterized protein n=1 Tax=Trichinella britovi TaxID=45882 RepID=A0A0V1B6Q0_TRIBR|nr:hypothetical protein T03_14187 [Trichinella britovi]